VNVCTLVWDHLPSKSWGTHLVQVKCKSISVAVVWLNVFWINWYIVGNKNGKNIKIFENVEEAKNGGVIYETKTIVSDHTLLTSQFGSPVSRVWCLTNTIKGLLHFATCNSTSRLVWHVSPIFHHYCCITISVHCIDTDNCICWAKIRLASIKNNCLTFDLCI
jgi:hypothetical protein